MNAKKYRIAIIGGGPAGIAAALEASIYTTSVALISQDEPGGRALWHSLTPSKVWLHAAGEQIEKPQEILDRLARVTTWQALNYTRHLQAARIDVLLGTAQFINATRLLVTPEKEQAYEINADKIIIATGSVPVFPDGLKPDGTRILAPRFLGKLSAIPKSIIIIGGGVTGSEMAYLFNQLGAHVSLITDLDSLLPRTDSEVSDALEQILSRRGVRFFKNAVAKSIENIGDAVQVKLQNDETLAAEHAFVAVGRRSDISMLNLQATHIKVDSGIIVDDFCQTNIESIYAAGDVTGAPMIANRAMAMGKIAAYNALNKKSTSLRKECIIEAVYTEPEVAQVGTVATARNVYRAEFSTNLKAQIEEANEGFVKVFVDAQHVVIGACAIGEHVADLMFSLALAIRAGLTIYEFMQVVPANPALSDVFQNLKF